MITIMITIIMNKLERRHKDWMKADKILKSESNCMAPFELKLKKIKN